MRGNILGLFIRPAMFVHLGGAVQKLPHVNRASSQPLSSQSLGTFLCFVRHLTWGTNIACLHGNWPRVERAAQPPRLHHFLGGEDRAEGGSSSHRHSGAKASASGGGKERISGCAQVNKELHKPHLPSILPGNAKGQSERGGLQSSVPSIWCKCVLPAPTTLASPRPS